MKYLRKVTCGKLNHKDMNMKITITILKLKFHLVPFMTYQKDKTYTN